MLTLKGTEEVRTHNSHYAVFSSWCLESTVSLAEGFKGIWAKNIDLSHIRWKGNIGLEYFSSVVPWVLSLEHYSFQYAMQRKYKTLTIQSSPWKVIMAQKSCNKDHLILCIPNIKDHENSPSILSSLPSFLLSFLPTFLSSFHFSPHVLKNWTCLEYTLGYTALSTWPVHNSKWEVGFTDIVHWLAPDLDLLVHLRRHKSTSSVTSLKRAC